MGTSSFTVFFDGQLTIGIAERVVDDAREVARVIFGKAPTEAEMLLFMAREYDALTFIGTDVAEALNQVPRERNPKRRQREAQREMASPRTQTRAQEAWSRAIEIAKGEHAVVAKERRSDERERRRALAVTKKKRRARGK